MKVSKTGYKKNSRDKNQESLLIPSGRITMKDVEFPVLGTDNYGNQQMMYPGQEYSFPGNYVYERPMKTRLNRYANGGAPCQDGYEWDATLERCVKVYTSYDDYKKALERYELNKFLYEDFKKREQLRNSFINQNNLQPYTRFNDDGTIRSLGFTYPSFEYGDDFDKHWPDGVPEYIMSNDGITKIKIDRDAWKQFSVYPDELADKYDSFTGYKMSDLTPSIPTRGSNLRYISEPEHIKFFMPEGAKDNELTKDQLKYKYGPENVFIEDNIVTNPSTGAQKIIGHRYQIKYPNNNGMPGGSSGWRQGKLTPEQQAEYDQFFLEEHQKVKDLENRKLGGSTGWLDRYDNGGPTKPKDIYVTTRLNDQVTVGWTKKKNVIYLQANGLWHKVEGADYDTFSKNNPGIIQAKPPYSKPYKPKKEKTQVTNTGQNKPVTAPSSNKILNKERIQLINNFLNSPKSYTSASGEILNDPFTRFMKRQDYIKSILSSNITPDFLNRPPEAYMQWLKKGSKEKIKWKPAEPEYVPLDTRIKPLDELYGTIVDDWISQAGDWLGDNIHLPDWDWIPGGLGGLSISDAWGAVNDRFLSKYKEEDPESIGTADVGQPLVDIKTSDPAKTSRTTFGFYGNNDIKTKSWKVADVGSDVDTDKLAKFSYTWDNNTGARYIVGNKEIEMEQAGAPSRFDNVYAVAHFLRDADILPGQKFYDEQSTHGTVLPNPGKASGKYISHSQVSEDPDKYWALYEQGSNPNEIYLRYKKLKDITDDDRKNWTIDLPTSGQHRFSDIDWDAEGTSTGYATKSKWLPLKSGAKNINSWTDKKNTRIPYKDKNGYSRFSGASVTYLWKDPQTGENIGRDVAGSIMELKNAGNDIIKKYGINPDDLEFVYHDTGSYSAKPAAYDNNVLNHRQWANYNSLNKGYSGAALMIPSKKLGGQARRLNKYASGGSTNWLDRYADGGVTQECELGFVWDPGTKTCVPFTSNVQLEPLVFAENRSLWNKFKTSYWNPFNWGENDYSNDFGIESLADAIEEQARKIAWGEDDDNTFMYNNRRYNLSQKAIDKANEQKKKDQEKNAQPIDFATGIDISASPDATYVAPRYIVPTEAQIQYDVKISDRADQIQKNIPGTDRKTATYLAKKEINPGTITAVPDEEVKEIMSDGPSWRYQYDSDRIVKPLIENNPQGDRTNQEWLASFDPDDQERIMYSTYSSMFQPELWKQSLQGLESLNRSVINHSLPGFMYKGLAMAGGLDNTNLISSPMVVFPGYTEETARDVDPLQTLSFLGYPQRAVQGMMTGSSLLNPEPFHTYNNYGGSDINIQNAASQFITDPLMLPGVGAIPFRLAGAGLRGLGAGYRGLKGVYNNVATGNSFLTDLGVRAWKVERPVNNSIYSTLSRPYITRVYTDRGAELLSKFGKGMKLSPQEWEEMTALTKSGATDFSKGNIPISRILGYYNPGTLEERVIAGLKRGDVFTTPTEKSIRTWSAGVPDVSGAEYLKGKTRLIIPSRYTKNLGSNFSAMPYDDARVGFIHEHPSTGMRPHLNVNATKENELMGNIPEGWKVIGKSSEDGMNNLIIKPIRTSTRNIGDLSTKSVNAAGDVAGSSDVIQQANAANYDFMMSNANIQKRAGFRNNIDPITEYGVGAPEIYGSTDAQLNARYLQARQEILNNKASYSNDPDFLSNLEKSKTYDEYVVNTGASTVTGNVGSWSDKLRLGYVDDFQPDASRFLTALHEGNHGWLTGLKITPEEKAISNRAWKNIINDPANPWTPDTRVMESLAVQRELRHVLGDVNGSRVYTTNDIPEIKRALQTLKDSGHGYLVNTDVASINPIDMKNLVISLNKIGLAGFTGLGVGLGLKSFNNSDQKPTNKLGGVAKYQFGGPAFDPIAIQQALEQKQRMDFEEGKNFVTDWYNSPMYNQMLMRSMNNVNSLASYVNKNRKENLAELPPLKISDSLLSGDFANSHNNTGLVTVYPSGFGLGPSLFVHEIIHSSDRPRGPWYFKDYAESGDPAMLPSYMKYYDPRFPDEEPIGFNRIIPESDYSYINKNRAGTYEDSQEYTFNNQNSSEVDAQVTEFLQQIGLKPGTDKYEKVFLAKKKK